MVEAEHDIPIGWTVGDASCEGSECIVVRVGDASVVRVGDASCEGRRRSCESRRCVL